MEKEKRDNKTKQKRLIAGIAVFVLLAFLLVWFKTPFIESSASTPLDYEILDLGKELSQYREDNSSDKSRGLTEEEYACIYLQTGLGRQSADKVMESENYMAKLKNHQKNFFEPCEFTCKKIGWITYEEQKRNEKGHLVKCFKIEDLRNGDILLTRATHSTVWRHGHAAIVTNAETGRALESVIWGQPSIVQSVDRWETYPSFIQLRVKESVAAQAGYESEELGELAAEYAAKELAGVPYGLFSTTKGFDPGTSIDKTQCSHLVWAAYMNYGLNSNSDGGWLVTPADISGSDLFEIVQIYGVDPDEIWF